MPSAFGSGWFTPPAARGIVHYLLAHGSRLLGMPRTYARTVYGDVRGAGIAPVYALGDSRLLADADQPDQLVLSLYGLRAAGMTDGTYISGEAVSVLPVRGAYDRAMFMPPNTGANASFLGTLRELLVHERRGEARPRVLDAASAWLADGKTIEVSHAPTSWPHLVHAHAQRSQIVGSLVCRTRRARTPAASAPAGQRLARVLVGSTVVRRPRRDDRTRQPSRRGRAPRNRQLASAPRSPRAGQALPGGQAPCPTR
jgi:hypothetical protein